MLVIHHENIHEVASLRFLNLNLEWHNVKMGRKTYGDLFFSFMRLCSKSPSCNQIPVVFIAAVFFNSYYNSYTWSKNITLTVKKVVLSGMYKCNFEAINQVLNKRMKKLEMEYGPFILYLILCIRYRKEFVMLNLP